jgi:hypothetical protein
MRRRPGEGERSPGGRRNVPDAQEEGAMLQMPDRWTQKVLRLVSAFDR